MPSIFSNSPSTVSKSSPSLEEVLRQPISTPCQDEDQSTFQMLAQTLLLNPDARIPPTTEGSSCGPEVSVLVNRILTGTSVDDPDLKIDQDLPTWENPIYDPNHDQPWMGGSHGPTSQGFRHMYFGGWQLSHPIRTFQIPPRAVGQAPARTQILSLEAKRLLREGHKAWGYRVAAWAMHYIQDLTQPFHAVQILNFDMVPWLELFAWPPRQGFKNLVDETTRIVGNYHLAYEGYVHSQLELGEKSPFKECLSNPEKFSTLTLNPLTQTPEGMAHSVADASIEISTRLGDLLFPFFSSALTQRGFDLAHHDKEGSVSYADLATRPDLINARKELHDTTCVCLANASIASRKLLEWILQP